MKILTTVYFEEEVFKKLKNYAHAMQVSKSEFIRQAVDKFIKESSSLKSK